MKTALKTELSPAERRRDRTRKTILMSAERLFAREGEAGLSIRKLADDIDYSPAAIYKYFESKQDLVDALKEAFFELLLSEMEEFVGAPDEYIDYAHDFLMTYVRTALSKPHHYAAAFAGLPDEKTPIKPPSEGSLKVQAFIKLRGMVKQGVELGVFRADMDVSQTAKSIWAAMHGFVNLMAHVPHFHAILAYETSPPGRDFFTSQHIKFILRGLAT